MMMVKKKTRAGSRKLSFELIAGVSAKAAEGVRVKIDGVVN